MSLFYVKSASSKEQMSRYFHRIIHAAHKVSYEIGYYYVERIISKFAQPSTNSVRARVTPQSLSLSEYHRILYRNSHHTKSIKFILCDLILYETLYTQRLSALNSLSVVSRLINSFWIEIISSLNIVKLQSFFIFLIPEANFSLCVKNPSICGAVISLG